jgi:hypothetical protein
VAIVATLTGHEIEMLALFVEAMRSTGRSSEALYCKRWTKDVRDMITARSYIELERKSRWQRQVEPAGRSARSNGKRADSRHVSMPRKLG